MENKIIQALSNDEVVRFIADRHNIGPERLVKTLITDQAKGALMLLDNEVAILRGLLNNFQKETI